MVKRLALSLALAAAPAFAEAATVLAASTVGAVDRAAATSDVASATASVGAVVDGQVADLVGRSLLSTDLAALSGTGLFGGGGIAFATLATFGDLLIDNRGNVARLDLILTLDFDARADGSGDDYRAAAQIAFEARLGDEPANLPLLLASFEAGTFERRDFRQDPTESPDLEDKEEVFSFSVPGGTVLVATLTAETRTRVFSAASALANVNARLTLTSAQLVAPETLPTVPLPPAGALLASALGLLALRRIAAQRERV